MNRPTREVKLPVTGYKATLVTFFTRSEKTQIESKRFEGASAGMSEDGKFILKGVNPQASRFEDSEILRLGVKKVVDSDGKDVNPGEACGDLPDVDTDFILTELNKNILSQEESKKKLKKKKD